MVTCFLHQRGAYLDIFPIVPGFEAAFMSVEHRLLRVPGLGDAIAPLGVPLVWPMQDRLGTPFLQTFAGLTSLIRAWLQRSGHELRVTGSSPSPLARPHHRCLDDFDDADYDLIDFI